MSHEPQSTHATLGQFQSQNVQPLEFFTFSHQQLNRSSALSMSTTWDDSEAATSAGCGWDGLKKDFKWMGAYGG